MTEDEAWDELETRLNKKKVIQMTDREALQIAYNALVEIDRQTPYPIAKHAIKCLNSSLNNYFMDQAAIGHVIQSAVLAEREACALVCEQIDNDGYPASRNWPSDCAKAIRARS